MHAAPRHLALRRTAFLLAAPLLLLPIVARADGPSGPGARAPGPVAGPVVGSDTPAKDREAIAWYGTLAGARAEAARSGRPILLLSAAPQCHGISGVW